MIFIAMDVHVRNSYLQITDEGGPVLKCGRCANTPSDFAAFLAPLGAGSGYAAMESTTNSRAVLIEAAWIAVKRVPAYHHLFERVARRKNKLTAVAVPDPAWQAPTIIVNSLKANELDSRATVRVRRGGSAMRLQTGSPLRPFRSFRFADLGVGTHE